MLNLGLILDLVLLDIQWEELLFGVLYLILGILNSTFGLTYLLAVPI